MFRANIRVSPDTAKLHGLDEDSVFEVFYKAPNLCIRQLSEEELLAVGIRPTTVRLSIGTEHIDDIIADLQHGFEAVK